MPESPDRPPPAAEPLAATAAVRIWDLPTRLFHGTLALAVTGSVVSAKLGAMGWHFRLGFLILGLLAFRLAWGLFGGRWSRFTSFIHGPAALWRYLRGRPRAGELLDVGHSPTGALSVFALLGLLAAQVGTGLVADDEIANLGPLNRFVSSDTALASTSWHRGWGQWLLLSLIALHLAAIVFYVLRRRTTLLTAMIGGDKPLPAGTPASADGPPQRLLALALALASAGLVAWVLRLGGAP